jgi:hypothetical protein
MYAGYPIITVTTGTAGLFTQPVFGRLLSGGSMKAFVFALLALCLSLNLTAADEKGRTVTTYSVDVRHDHMGKGGCNGKLLADDERLRFESVEQADHSRSWDYNTLSKFEVEKKNSIIKVTPASGDAYHFNTANGATAGAMHSLVSGKIVAARPAR